MFTRKHLKAIASVLAEYRPAKESQAARHQFDVLVHAFSDMLGASNPRFQPERFNKAVYGE